MPHWVYLHCKVHWNHSECCPCLKSIHLEILSLLSAQVGCLLWDELAKSSNQHNSPAANTSILWKSYWLIPFTIARPSSIRAREIFHSSLGRIVLSGLLSCSAENLGTCFLKGNFYIREGSSSTNTAAQGFQQWSQPNSDLATEVMGVASLALLGHQKSLPQ